MASKNEKNTRLKAQGCVFSRLLILLAVAVFSISLISAAEFDNVKSYDSATKELTIKNAFGLPNYLGGYEIAKVKLDSELNVQVGLGYHE